MSTDRHKLTFEVWKTLLENDCAALDKLPAFTCLSAEVLRLLYEDGLEPTVDAIVKKH